MCTCRGARCLLCAQPFACIVAELRHCSRLAPRLVALNQGGWAFFLGDSSFRSVAVTSTTPLDILALDTHHMTRVVSLRAASNTQQSRRSMRTSIYGAPPGNPAGFRLVSRGGAFIKHGVYGGDRNAALTHLCCAVCA